MKTHDLRILALLAAGAFLLQDCMTIVRRSSQRFPVTSNPMGAMITVDGNEVGTTPVIIKLKRNRDHSIRAELPGYNPVEIEIERKFSGTKLVLSALGNYLVLGTLGFIALGGMEGMFGSMLGGWFGNKEVKKDADKSMRSAGLGALLGTAIGLSVDLISGANYRLSPADLNVVLTKMGANPRQDRIFMDSRRFQSIKWIRIRLSPSVS